MEEAVKQLAPLGSLRRTHCCGTLRPAHVGQEAVLCGWVHRRRDHGGVVFVDLRDRTGLAQVVFKPDTAPVAHEKAGELRTEYVIIVRGRVEPRGEEAINPKLPTGEIELIAAEMRLLNTATTPPFAIEDDVQADEALRLRYRIHDLRRPIMQQRLALRHRFLQSARATCTALDFYEIETPMLGRSTPEGARDFLVPSRMYPGSFYALPQSPQIMKQLLMIAGFDRYFQIARCFRDEDQRADRQLEFSQVDLELAFATVEEVLEVLEAVTAAGCAVAGLSLPRPFERITYREAIDRYGVDRPDTRVTLELQDLTGVFASSEFRAFRSAVDAGGIVKCLPIHDVHDALSRGQIDKLEAFVKKELGGKGLAWVRVEPGGGWQSPIAKVLSDAERAAIAQRTGARPGSMLFFQADASARANAILARLRVDLGQRLGRVDGRAHDVL